MAEDAEVAAEEVQGDTSEKLAGVDLRGHQFLLEPSILFVGSSEIEKVKAYYPSLHRSY